MFWQSTVPQLWKTSLIERAWPVQRLEAAKQKGKVCVRRSLWHLADDAHEEILRVSLNRTFVHRILSASKGR